MTDPHLHDRPLWRTDADLPVAPTLDSDTQTDVVVVGAGIGGLTTALLLAEAGRSVVVVDRGGIAAGETAHTTAHLAAYIDDTARALESRFGAAQTRLAVQSQAEAIDLIERIAVQYRIACDFRRVDAYLFAAADESADDLHAEYEACVRAGLDPQWFPEAPAQLGLSGACIRFPRHARFHPLKYLAGVARVLLSLGGRIYGNTLVTDVREGTRSVQVHTAAGHVLTGQHCVVATNSPINETISIHTKQAPYMTYAIAYELPAGAVADALVWDNEEAYHYVRLQEHPDRPDHMLLIAGGADHKAGQGEPEEAYRALDGWTRQHYPALLGEYTRWHGMVFEPADGLPFLGKARGSTRTYLLTGDSGEGMTNMSIGAEIVRDLILGHENPYAELYRPTRLMSAAPGTYLRENLNVAAQFADYLTGSDGQATDLAPGQGVVVQHGLKPVAVYRDAEGLLHAHSAVCTHVGCVVAWDAAAQVWVCPCHGSRFSPTGAVLGGPATKPLGKADPVEENVPIQE